jgi:hypothetical protein
MNDLGLSRLQRDILCAIWKAYQEFEPKDYMLNDHVQTALGCWGVQWSRRHHLVKRRDLHWYGSGQSASQRVADCRALQRLERRGLVVRNHRFDNHYTDFVKLTDEGKAVAQRLTSSGGK